MKHAILRENEEKRQKVPFLLLVCFAMFCFWQMGFIYFMGPALSINGRTPLPISMDNVTTVIAISYVLSILWMIFLPRFVIWVARTSTLVALLTVLGLFLPLSDDILRTLIYIHVFSCCFMIGFETFIMVNFFSEESTIMHLTVAYGVALFLIAIVQNDFLPITFPIFRFVTVLAVVLLLMFFLHMPGKPEACPRYVKKADGLTAPKKLFVGTYILVFVSSLMGVSGPAIAGEATHGVFIAYLADAFASLAIYLLYKKVGLHPFHTIPFFIGLGATGFLLLYATSYVPWLSYVSCALIGFGMMTCQMLPLYGSMLMKSYPTKSIPPIIIGLALVAVLVQSSLVEIFRTAPVLLNLVYAVIMVILGFLYLQVEPIFLFTLRFKDSRIPTSETESTGATQVTAEASYVVAEDVKVVAKTETTEADISNPLDTLTPRELEVVELICLGYTNRDISKMLFISEHTVKDHTKKIYPKLGVHSRFELATLINRYKTNNN